LNVNTDAEEQASRNEADFEDFRMFVGMSILAVPAVAVMAIIIIFFVTAILHVGFPSLPFGTEGFAWLWINGPVVGAAIWGYRHQRLPLPRNRWINGPRAQRLSIAIALASFGSFILPYVLGSAFRTVWNLILGRQW
jgi:hypothetical protein